MDTTRTFFRRRKRVTCGHNRSGPSVHTWKKRTRNLALQQAGPKILGEDTSLPAPRACGRRRARRVLLRLA
jgi:hypothetical protein